MVIGEGLSRQNVKQADNLALTLVASHERPAETAKRDPAADIGAQLLL